MFKQIFMFVCFIVIPISIHASFIVDGDQLQKFYARSDIIMVASPGRSGSSMLTHKLHEYAIDYEILKTHILPPNKQFQGKIIFIFSNPDQAAESALHMTINNAGWGKSHFYHVESSDKKWLEKIGSTTEQTITDNLLSYDALGCHIQLVEWLYNTKPSNPENAQILAIKFENLWDKDSIQAIKDFLKIDNFKLSPKKVRGYDTESLKPREITFRNAYNLGTEKEPIYEAYDNARDLWRAAPAIQYLELP